MAKNRFRWSSIGEGTADDHHYLLNELDMVLVYISRTPDHAMHRAVYYGHISRDMLSEIGPLAHLKEKLWKAALVGDIATSGGKLVSGHLKPAP